MPWNGVIKWFSWPGNWAKSYGLNMTSNFKTATLGAGCFWCVEAVFQQLNGVHQVVSGYAGGSVDHPGYEQVCAGNTGHAEVVQIAFNPAVIAFENLLYVFWRTHDPTTLNRQGADVGSQYRSVIFYHDEEQKEIAGKSLIETAASGLWPDPIVTEISPFINFYPAEEYHHNYFLRNPAQGYCRMVIDPKIKKFKKEFKELLKK
jgi:peptide-methionine (S)-S-oxide reductase